MTSPYPLPDAPRAKSAEERAYSESVIAFSLQGLMTARKEFYNAERRRMMYYPNGKGPADDPPLERSKIKSPLERAKLAQQQAGAGTGANGIVQARDPNASVGLPHAAGSANNAVHAATANAPSHPRQLGKNGTPIPSPGHRLALQPTSSPYTPPSPSSSSTSPSSSASQSPSDSHLFTSTSSYSSSSSGTSSSSSSSSSASPVNSRTNSNSDTSPSIKLAVSPKADDDRDQQEAHASAGAHGRGPPKCADATFSVGFPASSRT